MANPSATPYHVKLLVVSAILLSESFSANMIFPLLPFMIKYFDVAESDEEVGYYAGLLASAFFLGQFTTSTPWGYVSDNYGRKITLMFGLIGNCIFTLMFGFSQVLWWAVLCRGFTGMMNGNVAAARTYLKEISTESQMARSFSIMGMTWGFGSLLGSFIGGILCMPCDKYPDTFDPESVFCTHPFLLPSIIASLVAFFGFISCFVFLEETLKKTRKEEEASGTEMASLDQASEETVGLLNEINSENGTNETDSGADAGDISSAGESIMSPTFDRTPTQSPVKKPVRGILKKANSSEGRQKRGIRWNKFAFVKHFDKEKSISDEYTEVPLTPTEMLSSDSKDNQANKQNDARTRCAGGIFDLGTQCYISISLYCILGYAYICFDEVYPLFAFLDAKSGGLNFQSEDIGNSLLGAGLALFFFQIYAYPKIDAKLGSLRTFQVGSVTTGLLIHFVGTEYESAILFVIFPNLHYLALAKSKFVVLMAVVCMSLKNCLGNLMFTPVFILIARTASKDSLGQANGVAQSIVSLCRSFGPWMAASAFAWSVSHDYPYPANFHFIFVCVSVMCLVLGVISTQLDPRVNRESLYESGPSSQNAVEEIEIV